MFTKISFKIILAVSKKEICIDERSGQNSDIARDTTKYF